MRPRIHLPVLLTTIALVVAACGGNDEATVTTVAETTADADAVVESDTELTEASTTAPPDGDEVASAAADLLPDEVGEGGVLSVGTSLQWPPFDYEDENGDPVGIDIDIVDAIAEELGLVAEFTHISFPSIIPGVSNGRFHIGVNQLNDNETRREEVNFVDYFVSSLGVLAEEGLEDQIDPANLCGLVLAVTQGSSQEELAYELADECEAGGEEELVIRVFPDSATTILATSSGQAEIFITNVTTGAYTADQPDSGLAVVDGTVPDTDTLSGIVIAKENEDLALAIQAALQNLIDDGTYWEILEEWGEVEQGVTEATINEGLGFSG